MKKLLALAASFGLLSSYVFAADLPTKAPVVAPAPPPAYNWTGFYIGLNGGYGIPDPVNVRFDSVTAGVADFFTAFVGGTPANANFSAKGGFGGGQVGYNWQLNPYTVVGLETDFQGSGIKDTGSVAVPNLFGSAFTFTASQKLNWFGTTRVRGGILATPNFLIYATGGVAYGEVERSASFLGSPVTTFIVAGGLNCPANSVCMAASESKTSVGWVAGFGLEWALWNRWTLRAEYQHIDLGDHSLNMVPVAVPSADVLRANFGTAAFDTVRGAINYRF